MQENPSGNERGKPSDSGSWQLGSGKEDEEESAYAAGWGELVGASFSNSNHTKPDEQTPQLVKDQRVNSSAE